MSKYLVILLLCFVSSVSMGQTELDIVNTVGGSAEMVNFRKVDEGETMSFDVIFPNAPGTPISIMNRPQGATFDGIKFAWTPGNTQSGLYEIHFYAVSISGGASHTTYKTALILVADTRFTIAESKLFQRLFTATDPDNDRVEISVNNLPPGATFVGQQYGPKLFSWIPDRSQKGKHPMTVIATDYPADEEPKTDISYMIITVAKKDERARYSSVFLDMEVATVSKIDIVKAMAESWLNEEG